MRLVKGFLIAVLLPVVSIISYVIIQYWNLTVARDSLAAECGLNIKTTKLLRSDLTSDTSAAWLVELRSPVNNLTCNNLFFIPDKIEYDYLRREALDLAPQNSSYLIFKGDYVLKSTACDDRCGFFISLDDERKRAVIVLYTF